MSNHQDHLESWPKYYFNLFSFNPFFLQKLKVFISISDQMAAAQERQLWSIYGLKPEMFYKLTFVPKQSLTAISFVQKGPQHPKKFLSGCIASLFSINPPPPNTLLYPQTRGRFLRRIWSDLTLSLSKKAKWRVRSDQKRYKNRLLASTSTWLTESFIMWESRIGTRFLRRSLLFLRNDLGPI